MRIGIDGHVLGKNIGGVERYVEKLVELVPDLSPQHDFTVFITRAMRARFAGDPRRNVQFVSLPVSDPLVQRSVVLPWAVRQHRLDVLQVQRVAPWACGACRIMLTVHDLVPIKYPGDYPGLRNRLIRLLTPGSLRRADMVACPTQSVCDDIARYYPGLRAPLRPFYLGADPARFTRRAPPDRGTLERHGIVGRYIFSPGAIEVRKNLEVVIRALAQLDEPARPHLILSGSIRDPAYFRRLQGLAASLGVAGHLRHLGFVPEADLANLYGLAAVCIAASHDEGFNLLPLEAMACGTPVLCSDIPVHRELFQAGAQFFPPDDVQHLSHEIAQHLANEVDRDAVNAGAQSCLARLSWAAMAARMAACFEELSIARGATQ